MSSALTYLNKYSSIIRQPALSCLCLFLLMAAPLAAQDSAADSSFWPIDNYIKAVGGEQVLQSIQNCYKRSQGNWWVIDEDSKEIIEKNKRYGVNLHAREAYFLGYSVDSETQSEDILAGGKRSYWLSSDGELELDMEGLYDIRSENAAGYHVANSLYLDILNGLIVVSSNEEVTIDGETFLKVLVSHERYDSYYYFHKASSLLYKIHSINYDHSSTVSDYRWVKVDNDSILAPFKVKQYLGEVLTGDHEINSIHFNIKLPMSVFEPEHRATVGLKLALLDRTLGIVPTRKRTFKIE